MIACGVLIVGHSGGTDLLSNSRISEKYSPNARIASGTLSLRNFRVPHVNTRKKFICADFATLPIMPFKNNGIMIRKHFALDGVTSPGILTRQRHRSSAIQL
jgi:hypothetical protein